MTCDELKLTAFDSHPRCWTQLPNSFCFLSIDDVIKVVEVLKMKDLFSELTAEQMIEITKICEEQRL
jgi:hypothetical protein